MFARPSFFVTSSRRRRGEHLLRDRLRRPVALPLFPRLHEPRVLGEAAGVEDEGLAVAVAERADAAEVLEEETGAVPPELFVTVTSRRDLLALLGERHSEAGEVGVPP